MKNHEKRIRESVASSENFSDNDLRALLADLDAMRAKAARYDYLRDAHWSDATLCCVLDPKANVRLGAMCPTGENLDCLIDAALKGAPHDRPRIATGGGVGGVGANQND